MQAIRRVTGLGDDGQKSILREREIGADGGVIPIADGVIGNDHVVAVIAAEKKYADHRAIIGRAGAARPESG